MRLPFPTLTSPLAVESHMYVCLMSGKNKEFAVCQTYKPLKHGSGRPPKEFIIEPDDITRNPFNRPSIIDCDNKFLINNVTISTELLTTTRKDICAPLYDAIIAKQTHPLLKSHIINPAELISKNHKISIVS